jgi:hypothetical protein
LRAPTEAQSGGARSPIASLPALSGAPDCQTGVFSTHFSGAEIQPSAAERKNSPAERLATGFFEGSYVPSLMAVYPDAPARRLGINGLCHLPIHGSKAMTSIPKVVLLTLIFSLSRSL